MVSPGSIFTDTAAFADEAAWHAAARELRRHRPLLRVEADGWPPFWALPRYDDVMEIERRPEVWLNTRRVFLQPIDQSAAHKASGTDMRMIIQMDDPDHKGYRGLTAAWFRPATLRQTMDSRLRELATRFVDQMAATGGTCDFASEIAKFYPLHVIMSILGVSESDEGRMLRLTQELLGPDDAELQRPGEERDQGLVETILDFFAYFQRLSADRRSTPTEDVASRIANGLVDGEEGRRTIAAVESVLRSRTRAQWEETLAGHDVCVEPVLDTGESFEHPQVRSRGLRLDPGEGRPTAQTGYPIRLTGTPAAYRRPAPGYGEHTDEVLAEAGYDAEHIAVLRAAGAIT